MDYFLDMPSSYNDYDKAKVVILPVPYDGTSTFVKGADKGPQAIIDASDSIELYDIEEDIEIYSCGIHTAKAVTENQSPEQVVQAVYQRAKHYINENKTLVVLGSEHSISIGAMQAHAEKYPNRYTSVGYHADLRLNTIIPSTTMLA